jgi:hypothetical protein
MKNNIKIALIALTLFASSYASFNPNVFKQKNMATNKIISDIQKL